MPNRLRDARERAGLSQADLARRAGVSRQTVSAVEVGRHAPAVDVALRLAGVVGRCVEDLFGERHEIPAAGLPDGAPVVAARVGDRVVLHPVPGLIAGDAAWADADGVVEGGAVRLLPGADLHALVVVGCDPVLGLCEAMVGRHRARRIAAVAGTSGSAMAALGEGRAHAGVVHGPEGHLPRAPRGVRRVHLARWAVGVALPAACDRGSLEAVLDDGIPLIQRDASAASQQAVARAAGDRLPRPPAVATGHVDAARRAALAGVAAVTFAPAARHHGLAFIPVETHAVELWVGERWLDHPGAEALLHLIGTDAFRSRVALVGDYDLEGSGEWVR